MHGKRARWDETAESYLTSSWHSNEAALDKIIAAARPRGGKILDIATGAGHAAFAFAAFADWVIASDTSQAMLDVAAGEADKRGLANIEFTLADAQNLPFAGDSFDGVVCRVAAHHFDDVPRFLQECWRVLKGDGYFVLIDTVGSANAGADRQIHQLETLRDPSHVRDYSVATWGAMVSHAGFRVVHEEVVSKPLDANEWMERMRVEPDVQEQIRTLIGSSSGAFREYLSPTRNGEALVFHLREMLMVLRK